MADKGSFLPTDAEGSLNFLLCAWPSYLDTLQIGVFMVCFLSQASDSNPFFVH